MTDKQASYVKEIAGKLSLPAPEPRDNAIAANFFSRYPMTMGGQGGLIELTEELQLRKYSFPSVGEFFAAAQAYLSSRQ